ncbi:MAG: ribonuclease Z [Nitrososphaeria archaeon]|nr:ribonuclease Z [Nitrososphaeria archaeon]
MSLKVIFLGTSSAIPVLRRSFPAIAVLRKDEVILLDCGEGTQRQMTIAKIGFCRKMKILITHLHGDHVGGLPGLLQTMSMLKRKRVLQIYGPKGIVGFIKNFLKYLKVELGYEIEINEVKEGLIIREREYEIYAKRTVHSMRGYSFLIKELPRPGRFHVEKAKELGIPEGPLWHALQEGKKVTVKGRIIEPQMVLGPPRPGRIIGFSGDTMPYKSLSSFFKNADLLVFEATYSEKDMEKARENMHSTSVDAAKIASEANVKMLALVHLSARYNDSTAIRLEALKYHGNVIVPEDLDVIEVPYPDTNEEFKVYSLKSLSEAEAP